MNTNTNHLFVLMVLAVVAMVALVTVNASAVAGLVVLVVGYAALTAMWQANTKARPRR